MIVNKPILPEPEFFNARVVNELEEFERRADVIVANSRVDALTDFTDKVYTRDHFGRDA